MGRWTRIGWSKWPFRGERAADRGPRPLGEVMARLLAAGRPIRVLEYGAGELEPDEARHFSGMCAALAEKTGGESAAVVFSLEAESRMGRHPTRVIRGAERGLGAHPRRHYDLVVHHPVKARGQTRPLPTCWAFIELEPLAVDDGYWVFTGCQVDGGQRCEHLRQLLEDAGCRPLAWGRESAWRYTRPAAPIPETAIAPGDLAPLSPEARMDAPAFLRLFDQVLAPLLAHRGPSFRWIFRRLLDRPGPYLIIETGSMRAGGDFRSDGQSTLLFDLFVNWMGGRVITIDIDPTTSRYSRTRTSQRTAHVVADSVRALRGLPEVGQADLLYLDSLDFDGRNPHPSSLHHLSELAAIWGRTRPGTLLAIDDCVGPGHGKHAYVAGFLESVGIRPVVAGYQTAWIV